MRKPVTELLDEATPSALQLASGRKWAFAFERGVVPVCGGGAIDAVHEFEDGCGWRGGLAHIVVVQEELLALIAVESGRGAYDRLTEFCRFRRGIGVIGGLAVPSIAGPEAEADDLVGVSLARDQIGAGPMRARRPENRVTARSKLPQKKWTGLALPSQLVWNCLNTSADFIRMRQKRCAASGS